MPTQPRKMKLQKSVGSETPNPHRAEGVGSGNSGTHRRGFRKTRNPRAWVPETPEPTGCGFRKSRNPQGVGSGKA